MDGLRYYVMPLLVYAPLYGAQEFKEQPPQLSQLQIRVSLPAGNSLNSPSRTFFVPLTNDITTIAAIKRLLKKEIAHLSTKQPACSCGGQCADIQAALILAARTSTPLKIAYMLTELDDTTTLTQLRQKGFDSDSILHAKLH